MPVPKRHVGTEVKRTFGDRNLSKVFAVRAGIEKETLNGSIPSSPDPSTLDVNRID